MKRWMLFFAVLSAAFMATAAALQMEQQTLAGKMVRLHVVANSNSVEDQAIKLQVRDAVLEIADDLNETQLRHHILQIREAARNCLREQGNSNTVDVTLLQERFPTRVYDTFSLPAGVYTALRVTIGRGEGENWWCVAFPSICFRATAEDLIAAAAAAGFTEEEVGLICGTKEYVLKFKAMELLEQLKRTLFLSDEK